jgi:hypothetical protein
MRFSTESLYVRILVDDFTEAIFSERPVEEADKCS